MINTNYDIKRVYDRMARITMRKLVGNQQADDSTRAVQLVPRIYESKPLDGDFRGRGRLVDIRA